jgi:hypothetical protein
MSVTLLVVFAHATQHHREGRDPQSAAVKPFGHGFLPRRASGRDTELRLIRSVVTDAVVWLVFQTGADVSAAAQCPPVGLHLEPADRGALCVWTPSPWRRR